MENYFDSQATFIYDLEGVSKDGVAVIARAIVRSNPEHSPTPALPDREGVLVEAYFPPPGELKGAHASFAITCERPFDTHPEYLNSFRILSDQT